VAPASSRRCAQLVRVATTLGYYIPGYWDPAGADTCSFTVAVDGTYYVKMQAQASGQNYTFSVKQTS